MSLMVGVGVFVIGVPSHALVWSVPLAFGDERDAWCVAVSVTLVPVAAPVCGGKIVQCVFATSGDGGDVVDLERHRIEVAGVVVDGFAADVAGRLVAGDDAAVPVAGGGVAFDGVHVYRRLNRVKPLPLSSGLSRLSA